MIGGSPGRLLRVICQYGGRCRAEETLCHSGDPANREFRGPALPRTGRSTEGEARGCAAVRRDR
ncbi:hypothetical protein DXZ75_07575 [Streptomyces sp. AcE210]|nr:hypothetical protein DXZ75_07575 [Streptomyces sp. AcE210]